MRPLSIWSIYHSYCQLNNIPLNRKLKISGASTNSTGPSISTSTTNSTTTTTSTVDSSLVVDGSSPPLSADIAKCDIDDEKGDMPDDGDDDFLTTGEDEFVDACTTIPSSSSVGATSHADDDVGPPT